jgi:hypothetical protein
VLPQRLERIVEEAWPAGTCFFGTVTGASVGYTLKYISKASVIGRFARDDRQKEFSLMSKQLGISYLTPAMVRWHKTDPTNRMCAIIEDGKKISLPRYYKERIFNSEERGLIKSHFEKFQYETDKEYYSSADYSRREKQKVARTVGAVQRYEFTQSQNQKL